LVEVVQRQPLAHYVSMKKGADPDPPEEHSGECDGEITLLDDGEHI